MCIVCDDIYEYEHDEQRSDDTKISIVSKPAVPPNCNPYHSVA